MKIRWMLLLLTVLLFPNRGNAIGIYEDQDSGFDPETPACLYVYEAKMGPKGLKPCQGRPWPALFDYCVDSSTLMEAVTENVSGVPLPAYTCGEIQRYVVVRCEGWFGEQGGGRCVEEEAIQRCQRGPGRKMAGRCVQN
ncbi:MAG: hypothetical protein A3F16_03220 [Deltaproteobacteria bacterium RIFCSPHIGHO2_12_FULL_43_9]|nr:MAG: hypothetical protein A3F16_03220 [Deltaproteobacteria bacterium RIFCSPHIGHO2_12_FULL_43_9]